MRYLKISYKHFLLTELTNMNHPAVELLNRFFRKMFDWEVETQNYLSSTEVREMPSSLRNEAKKQRRAILDSIYAEFCEAGVSAKRLKDQGFVYGTPRQYNPEFEIIDEIEAKIDKAVVYTHRTDCGAKLSLRYRYELVLKDGEWRIKDNKKEMFGSSEKWKPHLL